jgi:hypothetical protein
MCVSYFLEIFISVVGFRLEMKVVKGSGGQEKLCFRGHSGHFFHPTGLDLIKTVKGTAGYMYF